MPITNDFVWYWNSFTHTKEEFSVSDILLSCPQGYANLLFRCSTLIMLLHFFSFFIHMQDVPNLKINGTTLKSKMWKSFIWRCKRSNVSFMWLWNQTLPSNSARYVTASDTVTTSTKYEVLMLTQQTAVIHWYMVHIICHSQDTDLSIVKIKKCHHSRIKLTAVLHYNIRWCCIALVKGISRECIISTA